MLEREGAICKLTEIRFLSLIWTPLRNSSLFRKNSTVVTDNFVSHMMEYAEGKMILTLHLAHLAQGEARRLGLESAELGPLLGGDVLRHEGVRGLDVGEGRSGVLKWKFVKS